MTKKQDKEKINKTMKRYQIQCGAIDDFYFARNHEVALRSLVRRHKNPPLAPLMRFREVDEYNKRIGLWKYQSTKSIVKIEE